MTFTNLTHNGTPRGYYFSHHEHSNSKWEKAVLLAGQEPDSELKKVQTYQQKVCEFSCRIASDAMKVSFEKLSHPTRLNAEAALARQVAMYAAHVGFSLSQKATGAFFKRDRTTVAHACRLVEDMRDDQAFDQMMEKIEFVVNAARDGFEALLHINDGDKTDET